MPVTGHCGHTSGLGREGQAEGTPWPLGKWQASTQLGSSMCLSPRNLKPNCLPVQALTLHRARSPWLALLLPTGVLSHTHNAMLPSLGFRLHSGNADIGILLAIAPICGYRGGGLAGSATEAWPGCWGGSGPALWSTV